MCCLHTILHAWLSSRIHPGVLFVAVPLPEAGNNISETRFQALEGRQRQADHGHAQMRVILDSRKLVSEKSQYSTLATPPGLDSEAIKTSRSLSVDFKVPWMRLLLHRQPPVHRQYSEVFSMGGGGIRKKSRKRKRNMKGVVLSVLFKCFKEGKVKAYLTMALLMIDTISRRQHLQR